MSADNVTSALASAKAALDHANKAFPSPAHTEPKKESNPSTGGGIVDAAKNYDAQHTKEANDIAEGLKWNKQQASYAIPRAERP